MKKRLVIGIVSAGLILLGSIHGSSDNTAKLDAVPKSSAASSTSSIPVKSVQTCDGTTVTSGCTVDNINYKTYIYHPAVAEKTHTETETAYHEEVTGYCTLCGDGTYSPTCATGRGACSHHDGVAQWNAPVSRNVPSTSIKTVVDSAAKEAYYEKVTQ